MGFAGDRKFVRELCPERFFIDNNALHFDGWDTTISLLKSEPSQITHSLHHFFLHLAKTSMNENTFCKNFKLASILLLSQVEEQSAVFHFVTNYPSLSKSATLRPYEQLFLFLLGCKLVQVQPRSRISLNSLSQDCNKWVHCISQSMLRNVEELQHLLLQLNVFRTLPPWVRTRFIVEIGLHRIEMGKCEPFPRDLLERGKAY